MSENKKKINATHLLTLIEVGAIGLFATESFYFSQVIASKLIQYVLQNHLQVWTIIISLIYLLTVGIYLFYRDIPSELGRIAKSRRIDLAIIFLTGILISIYFHGFGSSLYKNIVSHLPANQLLVLTFLPFILMFVFLLRIVEVWLISLKQKSSPFFLSDIEKQSTNDDLLEFSEIAERFAERVINQNSPDSLVFGLDAPWGIGKSTFINFCKEYWLKKYKDKVIVYVFNPLQYEDRKNLLEKFIDGLTRTIQKSTYLPEVRPFVYRYSNFIRNTKANILGFLNFELPGSSLSIDDAFNDLETVLSSIDKKIVVVIDDLDRLNLSAIKDLLFTIKKGFTLPNVSYVLCYDTQNISALEEHTPDIDKITEFLEKFVNLKIGLYLSSHDLSQFISENLKKSLPGNSGANPVLVSRAIAGLQDIFKSPEYYQYTPFVGDIRKLKRLINIVLMLDIEKVDYDNTDFNNQDLIHLLLVYINYPNIFRKIYNTETGGKKGFFSALSQYEDGYPKEKNENSRFSESEYKNSKIYKNYLEKLNESQQFLLNKIFDVSQRLKEHNRQDISQDAKSSYACFNGDLWSKGGRNLESYLNLITRSSKPQTSNQYRFYLACKNRLIKGEKIEDILSGDVFSYSKGEASQKQLWNVIVNSSLDFTRELSNNIIDYLVNHLVDYSLFTHEALNLGLRHDLVLYLISLLDKVGWIDEGGKHQNNTNENVSEIARWVFGEGEHDKKGIIDTLAAERKGILGMYDLLTFRVFCSADRGNDTFNLQNALSQHVDPHAPITGSVKIIAIEEMREISQRVFQTFKSQYINKNIFDLVNKLTLDDLAGKYKAFIEAKVTSGEIQELDKIIERLKSQIKVTLIYQLGSTSIEFGIACGYYDSIGKEDKHDIHMAINDYLFNTCFNPSKNKKRNIKNIEHFLDYLLMTFASVFKGIGGHGFVPSINEFTKVLDKEKLISYWRENGAEIKSLNFHTHKKYIYTFNYTASYEIDLPDVYKVLDESVNQADNTSESQIAPVAQLTGEVDSIIEI